MLDPDGIVTSWNAGAERIKGYTAQEIIGRHFSQFYTEEDRANGVPDRALSKSRRTTGKFEAEARRVRKDGTLFWANVVIDAIRDHDGGLIGFAKITRDITERRNAQEALERAQAQLAQAQKMEALGQLTGGVAHDFNNLLMIVTGQAQMLLRRLSDPKNVRALEAIQSAAARGETLTRQLLMFSRRQSLNPRTVDRRRRPSRRSRTCWRARCAAMSNCKSPCRRRSWPLSIDISEFELALVNLVVNARDAMPEGGQITVSAANVTLGGEETPETSARRLRRDHGRRYRRRHCARRPRRRSSSRSSPPRTWARAPGSACRRSMASRSNPAARSPSTASLAAAPR